MMLGMFRLSGRAMLLSALLSIVPALAAPTPQPALALALSGLPLYYQGYNDCGPASIAMVLGYYGITVPVTTISQATKPSQASYMRVDAIAPYVGQYGLETVTVHGGRIDALQRMVALGVPTIVLQYFVQVGKVPHFRIVRGFDQPGQWLYLADPLVGYAKISYTDFETLWNTQGRTFVAVYPPTMRRAVLDALRM